MTAAAPRFTTNVLDWAAWIAPVDVRQATPEQIAALEESGPHAKTSQYYHLLLHDAEALRQRSALFNAIMYGRNGLKRADRELGAAVDERNKAGAARGAASTFGRRRRASQRALSEKPKLGYNALRRCDARVSAPATARSATKLSPYP